MAWQFCSYLHIFTLLNLCRFLSQLVNLIKTQYFQGVGVTKCHVS